MKYCKFLEHYRQYTQGNETPEMVHIMLGLATLAGAAGKQYWLNRGFFNVFLNLYVLIVAPPGVVSKSSSMDLSRKLLDDVGATVYSGAITKAKLVEDMVEAIKTCRPDSCEPFNHCSVTFLSDEFNMLLASGGIDIIRFLTEIYSTGDVFKDRTKGQGQYEIPYPALTLVGNLVPEWFGKNLANDASSTGLLARFIPIYEDTPRGSFSKPVVHKDQLDHRKKALEILFSIVNNSGEIKMTDAAEKMYDEWYGKQKIEDTEQVRIAEYLARKIKVHSLKIAALMALGDMREEVETIDVERAIHLLEKIDTRIRLAYMMAGANPHTTQINRILKVLNANGGRTSMKKLARMLHNDVTIDDFKSIISQIEEMGYAVQTKQKGELYLERVGG